MTFCSQVPRTVPLAAVCDAAASYVGRPGPFLQSGTFIFSHLTKGCP